MYCFYHADDPGHENDLEGCLVIVKKDGSDDILQGIITVVHLDFWPFTVKDDLEIVDSQLIRFGKSSSSKYVQLEDHRGNPHPTIKSEPKKHGLYAWGSEIPSDLAKYFVGGLPKNDSEENLGIRYVPGTNGEFVFEEDAVKSFPETTRVYELIDLLGPDGFWNE